MIRTRNQELPGNGKKGERRGRRVARTRLGDAVQILLLLPSPLLGLTTRCIHSADGICPFLCALMF